MEFTVASFNAHWGVGRRRAHANVRFDAAEAVRRFDADVVVVPESWRSLDGTSILEPLVADGYTVEAVPMRNLHLRHDGKAHGAEPGHGTWELGICSRFPVVARREIATGTISPDPTLLRHALGCTIDVGGTEVELIGFHASSRIWYLAPVRDLRILARHLPSPQRPAVLAGDFNLWGPAVSALLPGWQRAVRGRTFPAHVPHSQIDHILVNARLEVVDGKVLPATVSDHLPIRARAAARVTALRNPPQGVR